jgi:cobalt-zinc-cadmium efflux system protein
LITLAEFVGGIMSGYLALLADAVHNLSDVAALILAWLGVKGSQMAATKRSTFGYKRIEVMTALISATSLVLIAIYIFGEAYDRFINPVELKHPVLFLSVAVIGLLGNIFSVIFLSSEKGKSLNMKTAFLHMTYDAVSSVAVIAGAIIIMYTGWNWLDALLSAAIGLMILWSSYLVIKEAVWILLEGVPDSIDFDEICYAIKQSDHVIDVHDLHVWSLSSHDIALSCHVAVDDINYNEGPDIIATITKMLDDNFHIGHVTIQLEKEDCAHPDLACKHPDGACFRWQSSGTY